MSSRIPPESDMDLRRQVEYLSQQMKKMEEITRNQHEEIQDLRKTVKNPASFKQMYRDMGGEELFYMDIDSSLPQLMELMGDDENKKQELQKWAKEAKQSGKKRIAVSVAGSVAFGAACGGASIGVHAFLLCGACSMAAAGSLVGVVAIAAVGMGAVVLTGIGIYKLIRMYKMRNVGKNLQEEEQKFMLV